VTRRREEAADALLDEARTIVEALQKDEVDAVIGNRGVALLRLKEVEEQLRRAQLELEARVAERTSEATWRSAQLRSLALELTEAEERERRRLAVMLHDGLQQELVAIRFQLDMLGRKLTDDDCRPILGELVELATRSIRSCRSLSMELSPPLLYQEGLAAALEWLAQSFADKHGLQVSVNADESAEPDDERLMVFLFQAAREALFNVVKHADVDRASLTLRRLDGEVELAVEDRGAGFDPSELDDLSRSVTGFGLLSVRERAELLGATVEISSDAESGTRLSLRWPDSVADAPEADDQTTAEVEDEPHAAADGADGRLRVLLVDDHAVFRQGLRSLLDLEEDLVVVGDASDGAQGVEAAVRLQPDVVVIDVAMPVLDGMEATRRIRRRCPRTRIIGLSMFEDEIADRRMREAGAVAYLSKTGPSRDLLAAIRGRRPDPG
jgi:signal transduction histidine kinase/ActR/RegA family two-component response regulator